MRRPYEIDKLQNTYFVLDDFRQLFDAPTSVSPENRLFSSERATPVARSMSARYRHQAIDRDHAFALALHQQRIDLGLRRHRQTP